MTNSINRKTSAIPAIEKLPEVSVIGLPPRLEKEEKSFDSFPFVYSIINAKVVIAYDLFSSKT